MRCLATIVVLLTCVLAWQGPKVGAGQPTGSLPYRVVTRGTLVTLESPAFRFTLDTADGLRAVSWENRLSGRRLSLGRGPEVEFDIGLPGQPLRTPKLKFARGPQASEGAGGEAVFKLTGEQPEASVAVTYRWDARQPVLRKFVTIANRGGHQWNRLLNVRLGTYQTDAGEEPADPDYPAALEQPINDPAGRTRGFPAYVEWQFFAGLAHPAGFATREGKGLALRQLPGAKLAVGATFECMEAVYGVSRAGEARPAFRDFVQARMRRVLRGHDKPLAIFEPFGAKPDGSFWETEEFVSDNLAKVAQGQRESGLHWDYYSIDFWHDPKGDLKTPDAGRFPHGFTRILPVLNKLGTLPGLWVDSGSWGEWTVGENPALRPALTSGSGRNRQGICRATEPANRFYIDGYAHQLRANGVRLVKFDNACMSCNAAGHEHLPGEYSTEPIQNALIEFYRDLDRRCPDVFIMLYWNYLSPWWLQYADTVFDVGMHMEGASFSPYPALRARDSVARRLDRGRWMLKDFPALGWDTLGVWLSDWPWNSRIGKEAWQSSEIMDISRGHLMAQIWSDTPYLSPDERRQMADLLALLKDRPECFRNSRFILGNPWKDEPYGYCSTDGRRAFLAINNGVWQDNKLTLELSSKWGLPDAGRWDLYRCYPNPARLGQHGPRTSIALRPFEIVLLEAVPAGQAPTLNRQFPEQAIPTSFAEPSRELPLAAEKRDPPGQSKPVAWTRLEPAEFQSTAGSTLAKLPDGSLLAGGENPPQDSYIIKAAAPPGTVTAIRLETLTDPSLPHNGPGRAVNGNFTLAEFRVSAGNQPLRIARARADFFQTSFGGWPAEAAIDGQPRTGWGIDPMEGVDHVAVFELERPLDLPRGGTLEFRLDHAGRQHSIGRLRLAATSATPPIHVPQAETHFVLRATVPATKTGGMLAVSDAFFLASNAYWTRNARDTLTIAVTLAGKPVAMEAVVQGGYPAPWQTWRLAVDACDVTRPLELRLTSTLGSKVEHRFAAHFIPR